VEASRLSASNYSTQLPVAASHWLAFEFCTVTNLRTKIVSEVSYKTENKMVTKLNIMVRQTVLTKHVGVCCITHRPYKL
jgi:hypothetical protein